MSINAMAFTGMLGVGVSSIGAYQQAQADNYSKQWNSFVSAQQAELATAKASIFRAMGKQEYDETLLEYEALASRQRAEYGASGVNVNVGSALETQKFSASQGVYEAQKAQYQRELQAWEMDMEARAATLDSQFNITSQRNPWIPAASAAIGGISSVFNSYGQWQKQNG